MSTNFIPFPGAPWQVLKLAVGGPPSGTGAPKSTGPWRPPQWQKPQLFSISGVIPSRAGDSSPTTYFFDAVLRTDHYQELRKAEHPIQAGASVVDHAYLMPGRLAVEIGMSDAMASYKEGQFTSDTSKSISAYQTLKQLQALRIPLTVTTKLETYKNMLVETRRASDTFRTVAGLRVIVTFSELLVGTVVSTTTSADSARPQQSNGPTNEGAKQPLTLNQSEKDLLETFKPQPIH